MLWCLGNEVETLLATRSGFEGKRWNEMAGQVSISLPLLHSCNYHSAATNSIYLGSIFIWYFGLNSLKRCGRKQRATWRIWSAVDSYIHPFIYMCITWEWGAWPSGKATGNGFWSQYSEVRLLPFQSRAYLLCISYQIIYIVLEYRLYIIIKDCLFFFFFF
jgi:hypothetical protein